MNVTSDIFGQGLERGAEKATSQRMPGKAEQRLQDERGGKSIAGRWRGIKEECSIGELTY